jgi:hypothetical protein
MKYRERKEDRMNERMNALRTREGGRKRKSLVCPAQ